MGDDSAFFSKVQGGEILRAVVNASTSGAANTIVAAVAGKKIRVIFGRLVASGTVTGTFKSNTTAIDGPIDYVAQSGYILTPNDYGWIETAAGEALMLTLSAGVAINGVIGYVLIG